MKIYQIESTNVCNAACSYCPHSKMKRKQGFMQINVLEQILKVISNKYVALHHFGEPSLNKNLCIFIKKLREIGVLSEFSTNGCVIFNRFLEILKERPYIIRYAYDYFGFDKNFLKFLTDNTIDTIIKTHSVIEKTKPITNFAGQMPGNSEIKGECYFKKYKFVCVLWNGDIVPCCCDYEGKHIIGNVFDGVSMQDTYELCENCDGMQFASDGLWYKDI